MRPDCSLSFRPATRRTPVARALAALLLVLSAAASAPPVDAQEIVSDQLFRVETGLRYGRVGVRNDDGTAGTVYAMRRVGDDLYVGGRFDSVGDIRARSIVRYHAPTRTWHALGGGVSGAVHAIEFVEWGVAGTYLYVGGRFERTGSLHRNLAIWRPDLTAWQDAGGAPTTASVYAGTDPDQTPGVYAIHKVPSGSGSAVYVGGTFDLIERWSGPESRTQESTTGLAVIPGPGLSVVPASFGADNIRALESAAEPTAFGTTSHRLVVGGSFARVYGGSNAGEAFRNIAVFSVPGDAWHGLGVEGGGAAPRGLGGSVLTLTRSGTAIYAGGRFDAQLNGDGTALNGVAVLFDEPGAREAGWYAVLSSLPGGGASAVTAIAAAGDRLCIGGRLAGREPYDVLCFDTGEPANARETVVHDFAGGQGAGLVYALDLSGADLIVGGQFSGVQSRESGVVRPANSLATRRVGASVYRTYRRTRGLHGFPSAYAASSDRIYIAGITQVDADSSGGLVVYDPATRVFTPLTAAVRGGAGAPVRTMLVSGDTLFVGGDFTEVYDAALGWRAQRYAARLRLSTQAWIAPTQTLTTASVSGRTGLTRLVRGGDGRIYAGGAVVGGLLRWNGTTQRFETLGAGIARSNADFSGEGPVVNDIAVFPDGTVAAAGLFDLLPQPGGAPLYTSNVAWLFPGTAAWTPRRGGTTNATNQRYGPAFEVYALSAWPGAGTHVVASGTRRFPSANVLPPDTSYHGLVRSYTYGAGGAIFDWTFAGPGVNGPVYHAVRRGDVWLVAGDFTRVWDADRTPHDVACLALLDLPSRTWRAPSVPSRCPDGTAASGAAHVAADPSAPDGALGAPAGTGTMLAARRAAATPLDYVFLDVSEMSVAVLPVERTAFTAQADGADVLLRWQTASETNNAGFAVEHAAASAGGAWREVAVVAGQGTTREAHAYAHRVTGLAPGAHRFRLVQRDLDGTATVSSVVEVTTGTVARVGLAHDGPNPARGDVRIAYDVPDDRAVRVVLVDLLGRRVEVLAAGPQAAGRHRVVVPAGRLAAGVYVVRLDHPSGSATLPVVVQ